MADCDYYRRKCDESSWFSPCRVIYYCYLAPLVCENAGEGEWTNCVRICLQDIDKEVEGQKERILPRPLQWIYDWLVRCEGIIIEYGIEHIYCFLKCLG